MAKWIKKSATTMVVVVGLGLLAACGSDKNNESGASAQAASSASSSANAQASTGAGTTADAQTRTVRDEFGEVTVPAHPKRIAAIYLEDYLKALGIAPVVQWYNPNWGKQDYLNLDVPLFDNSGSIEALLAQSPDLIILDGAIDRAAYDQYSKVAPTFRLPESVLQDSGQILKTIADVIGIPEKAESVAAAYEAKVADAKAKLAQAVGKETVAVIRVNVGDRTIALFGAKNRYAGSILFDDLGLTPHPMVEKMTEFQEILSEEAFSMLDADHIIVIPSNGDWKTAENQDAFTLLDSPMWKSVPAFKNGHVYKVDRSYWQSGAITANGMKIDDLLKLMVK
ncbi:ABC transporter substrate-binding protein [Cohnella hashimotonis]|uniref:ABC transporter substrate-binding protein n=1 Tax=Cohnella hashimotonis TaxID=2826895 RepID=A0ABT6TEE6_9BACL|nr:ABC transporter substrate-binding protein [Cohnella hashimotonis]MDI4645208.1 ABC transporter substrate-binding protein [Cohnella hashimotonis]